MILHADFRYDKIFSAFITQCSIIPAFHHSIEAAQIKLHQKHYDSTRLYKFRDVELLPPPPCQISIVFFALIKLVWYRKNCVPLQNIAICKGRLSHFRFFLKTTSLSPAIDGNRLEGNI